MNRAAAVGLQRPRRGPRPWCRDDAGHGYGWRRGPIAAVVYYLKAVSWSIPGYSLEKHRDRLRALHEDASAWPVMTSGHRFLLVASKPR